MEVLIVAVVMQLLRLLRLLRLVRLVRMIRIARIFRRWESHIGISYSHLKLIRFSVAVLVCAHWLACGFFLVTVLEDTPVSALSTCMLGMTACSSLASGVVFGPLAGVVKSLCCRPETML